MLSMHCPFVQPGMPSFHLPAGMNSASATKADSPRGSDAKPTTPQIAAKITLIPAIFAARAVHPRDGGATSSATSLSPSSTNLSVGCGGATEYWAIDQTAKRTMAVL